MITNKMKWQTHQNVTFNNKLKKGVCSVRSVKQMTQTYIIKFEREGKHGHGVLYIMI